MWCILTFFVLPALLLLSLALHASADTPPRVVISELCWMGSHLSTADEWLELTVVGGDGVDVTGWTVTSLRSDGTDAVIVRFSTGTVLPPGASVIGNNTAATSALAQEPFFTVSSMSLPNTKLHVQLFDAAGVLVDEADDGVGEPMAGSNVSGQSKATMERVDLAVSGSLPTNWATADVSRGFDADAPMQGTPGFLRVLPQVSSSASSEGDSAASSSLPASSEHAAPGTSASSSAASVVASAPQTSSAHGTVPAVWIAELLPNPVGSDDQEWLELATEGEADLTGFAVSDGSRVVRLDGRTMSGVLLLPKADTGLSFANAGGKGTVLFGGVVVDTLSYGAAIEGVSVGRLDGDDVTFCIPTPGEPNRHIAPVMDIELQSGSFSGPRKVTFNVQTVMRAGTLTGATCSVDFGDGAAHDGCNPPSHTISVPGEYLLTVDMHDVCGNALTRTVAVHVEPAADERAADVTQSVPAPESLPAGMRPATAEEVRLVSVVPNPKGDDRVAGEAVTLRSLATVPVSLRGFSLESGKYHMDLDGVELPPATETRLRLQGMAMVLANASGSVVLAQNGLPRATIAWRDAKEDVAYVPMPVGGRTTAVVIRVIDGDTVEIADEQGGKETVRLRGIDAPEVATFYRGDSPYALEAKNFLAGLLKKKNIDLYFDTEYQDSYGRTLAYVHNDDGTDVQRALLEQGLANVIPKVDFSRRTLYEQAEVEAKERGMGLWGNRVASHDAPLRGDVGEVSGDTALPSVIPLIRMTEIFPSPKKGEHEWVELQNIGHDAVHLGGWALTEEASGARRRWAISAAVLSPGDRYVVSASGSLQLNNGGQLVTLRDAAGDVADELRYPSIATGKSYGKAASGWCVGVPTPENETICDARKKATVQNRSTTMASNIDGLPSYFSTIYVPDTHSSFGTEPEPSASGTALQLRELASQELQDSDATRQGTSSLSHIFFGTIIGVGGVFLYRKVSLRIAEMMKF